MRYVLLALTLVVALYFVVNYYVDTERKPTATCKDSTISYSKTRMGTCSYHGGVLKWAEK